MKSRHSDPLQPQRAVAAKENGRIPEMKKRLLAFLTIALAIIGTTLIVSAAPDQTPDITAFDAAYYAAAYPDVFAVFGNDAALLEYHYQMFGQYEGRYPNAAAQLLDAEMKKAAQEAAKGKEVDFERRVVDLVNARRSEAGLSALSISGSLENAADIRAKEIGQSFSHTRPDGSSCFSVLSESYRYCGENIAMGQADPESVMNAWMNSDGHRANILNSNFTQIGVGYNPECSGWVQIFFRPQ